MMHDPDPRRRPAMVRFLARYRWPAACIAGLLALCAWLALTGNWGGLAVLLFLMTIQGVLMWRDNREH